MRTQSATMALGGPVVAPVRLRWLTVVAAVGGLAIAAATGSVPAITDLLVRVRTHVALEQLAGDLAPAQLPTARFSAIPGTRARSSMRGTAPIDLTTEANAGRVLAVSVPSSSPYAATATAAALVVMGKAPQAVAVLEQAVAHAPGEARLWSDLAAARLESGGPLSALVAADKALRIDPRSVDALHNRAMALDRLGLRPVAVEAWQKCLEATTDAQLAAVVRGYLRAAEMPSERERWRAVEKDFLEAARTADHPTVDRITSLFPRFVRASAEAPYLAKWAEAIENDPARADEQLRVVRTVGAALRRRNETLVAEAVAAIDEAIAQRDAERVALLARAHLAYDHGKKAYGNRDNAVAEPALRDAAAAFKSARSPMERAAQSAIASVLLNVPRTDEAYEILTAVLAAERPRDDHRALVAASEYSLSIVETLRGRWDGAVEAARRSMTLYHELRETADAALSESMLASILGLLGQHDASWEHRIHAFGLHADGGMPTRLRIAVGSGARAAVREGDGDLALSLLDIEMSLAALNPDPTLAADLLTRRGLLLHERGAPAERDAAFARARVAVDAIASPAERARYTIELEGAEAIVIRNSNPARAIELLSRVIAFDGHVNRRFSIPYYLLQRGRAHLAAGRIDFAWQDFSTAMNELETQRGTIQDLDLRSRMLDMAGELFDEAIALQVRRGDGEAAFRVAERARARALLDVLDGHPQPVTASSAVAGRLGPDTLLVEYAVLPDQLVLFAIRADGMRMHTVAVKRDELSSHPKLADILLGPVRDQIATARRLILVPDDVLQRTAFAALSWNGDVLAATHAISEAPSASRLVASAATTAPERKSALIVGSPDSDPDRNLGALPSVAREIAATGAVYPRSRVLFGPEATKERFMREAPRYDIIHFAGHGLSNEDSATASLLFSDSQRMDTADIAKLRLQRRPLVVLAACGTLRGQIAGVEGMPSLARSFIAAGASAVVGTLTDIDDGKAADLLTSFHRHISAGAPAADALRSAQMEAIARGGDAADPKNWAHFVVYTATP